MRSNSTRIAVGVGGIAALVVLFVVLNGGGGGGDKSKTQVISVRNAKPVGGIGKLDYTKGDQVRFKINSDVADEIHVHGYDFHKNVPAGGSVSFSFPAKIDGVFVIELESRGEQIAELTVKPA